MAPEEEKIFKHGRKCPRCGCVHVVRNGCQGGKQKYKCRGCGRSFTLATGTILASTKKSLSVWKKYLACFMNRVSICDAARQCGINKNTSFLWRHKILDMLRSAMESEELAGIVEADKAYFPASFKGNHVKFVLPRAARKRGVRKKRGLGEGQVCVPCALGRGGGKAAKPVCVGAATSKALDAAFGKRLSREAVLCTDDSRAASKFAKEKGNRQVRLKGGKRAKGIYHIQTVNSYHSSVKGLVRKLKGVSSKYLGNYLAWSAFLFSGKTGYYETITKLMSSLFAKHMTVIRRTLSCRPAIPELQ